MSSFMTKHQRTWCSLDRVTSISHSPRRASNLGGPCTCLSPRPTRQQATRRRGTLCRHSGPFTGGINASNSRVTEPWHSIWEASFFLKQKKEKKKQNKCRTCKGTNRRIKIGSATIGRKKPSVLSQDKCQFE